MTALAASLAAQNTPAAMPPSLGSDEIIRRAVARAKWTDGHRPSRDYVFTRHVIREELDGRGAVKNREERVYQVVPISETARFARLVQKDGRPLAGADLAKEQEREKTFRENLRKQQASPPSARKPNENEVRFNEDLAGRYIFQVAKRELVNGRPAFLLTVRPRSKDLPVRGPIDRVLNKLAGQLWIDEVDFEICRVDVYLTEKASLWGGLAGSLRRLDLFIERAPVDGVWLDSRVRQHVEGRMGLKSLRERVTVTLSDHRKATPAPGQAAKPAM